VAKQCYGVEALGGAVCRPDDQVCGRKTLHINAKKVKFHRTLVISSKMTNGKQILNNVGSKKNVVEIEWAQNDRVT
jgi:hypothetical protein